MTSFGYYSLIVLLNKLLINIVSHIQERRLQFLEHVVCEE